MPVGTPGRGPWGRGPGGSKRTCPGLLEMAVLGKRPPSPQGSAEQGDEERVVDPGSWEAGTVLGMVSAYQYSPAGSSPWPVALRKHLLEGWCVAVGAELRAPADSGHREPGTVS